jgi:ABC-type bacteriocin/lantibiotic exporter with double-glycine peptidase domain
MLLKVPLKNQSWKSVLCGPCVMEMIYKYYGLNKTTKQICKEMKIYSKIGTFTPQLGTHFIKNGLDAEIVTLNPRLVTKRYSKLSQKELLKQFIKNQKKYKNRRDKISFDFFIEFLKNGGKLKVKIPDKNEIIREIKNGRPVICSMTTKFLYNMLGLNGHFVVVSGISDNTFFVNDPLQKKIKSYSIDEFIYGIHASAKFDLDNAAILKIRKAKK